MTLRRKTLLVLGLTLAAIAPAIYGVARFTMLRSFRALEAQQMQQDMERASRALDSELSIVNTIARDDATWDEAYEFVQHPNPTFPSATFAAASFYSLHIEMSVYTDSLGRVVYGRGFDRTSRSQTALPDGLLKHLVPGRGLLNLPTPESSVRGILVLPSGPVLIASSPVITSRGEGPIQGALVMGRRLDAAEVEQLAATTNLKLQIVPLTSGLRAQLGSANPSFTTSVTVLPLDADNVAGYQTLNDLQGNPVLVMRAQARRDILQKGRSTLLYLAGGLLVVGVVFILLSLFLLEKLVLSRLIDLGQKLAAIGDKGDLAARISITGNDELTRMAQSLNQMLEALQRAEAGRQHSEAGYHAFVEQSAEGIWRMQCTQSIPTSLPHEEQVQLLFQHGRLAECNQAIARMYGAPSEHDLLNAGLSDFLDPNDPSDLDHVRAFVRDAYQLRDAETRKRDHNGREKWVLHNLVGILEDNQLVGAWGIQRDVTERKNMEEQLRQSQKMEAVGTLAGGVAHDFNNLLTVIKGYSRLVAEEVEGDAELAPKVQQIERAADRAAALTRQLLAFSRRQVLEPKVLNLNATVSSISGMLQRLIGEHIQVVTTLASDLGSVLADPNQIEQVLLNLVVNARDAMPHGGQLMFETSNLELDGNYAREHVGTRPGRYVQLVVADTGIGMDPATQAHIFEPFFTTKELGRGTGLGLSTVYGIVKQSEGYITVESELGKGSRFQILLPRVDKRAEVVPAKELPSSKRGSETILLVEDDDALRELTNSVLSASGYKILTASRPEDAERICQEQSAIDLLVTDVVMPGGSGHALAGRLTEQRSGMKVLYMSGYSNDLVSSRGLIAPGAAFLEKPFTPSALRAKVREVLDSSHSASAGAKAAAAGLRNLPSSRHS